jgi:hypothetical protein
VWPELSSGVTHACTLGVGTVDVGTLGVGGADIFGVGSVCLFTGVRLAPLIRKLPLTSLFLAFFQCPVV